MLPVLTEMAGSHGHLFGKVYVDGAYSSVDKWKILSGKGAGFATSFKSNMLSRNRGGLARGEAARLLCGLSYDEWKKVSGYGARWRCECVFNSLKRIFSDTVAARSEAEIIISKFVRLPYLIYSMRATFIILNPICTHRFHTFSV